MRSWARLSGAERVGVYTRTSLYLVLWSSWGLTLLRVENSLGADDRAAFTAAGFVVVAVACAGLAAALRSHPRLPARPLVVALVAVSAGYAVLAATSWEDDVRDAALAMVVMSVTMVLGLRPGRQAAVGLLVLGALVLVVAGDGLRDAPAGLVIAGAYLFTVRASMWVLGVVSELDRTREAQARLSVAEERLRFSRDVHDVLGRRLSAIAVQSELAATLARRGDEQAVERMLEVRRVAHDALGEARSLARGYRVTDFGQEVDGARSLLRSAGIDVRVAVEDMPRAWHEAAGWVVREGVTNVLRHSHAGTVEIAYDDGRLRIANDGANGSRPHEGTGLRGLRERLGPLGATLEADSDGNGGWTVVAELPGTGPLSGR